VPRRFIGTDAFQETPIVEITRAITKHNYLVMDVKDLPRIVKEAFYLARSGRPGACWLRALELLLPAPVASAPVRRASWRAGVSG